MYGAGAAVGFPTSTIVHFGTGVADVAGHVLCNVVLRVILRAQRRDSSRSRCVCGIDFERFCMESVVCKQAHFFAVFNYACGAIQQ